MAQASVFLRNKVAQATGAKKIAQVGDHETTQTAPAAGTVTPSAFLQNKVKQATGNTGGTKSTQTQKQQGVDMKSAPVKVSDFLKKKAYESAAGSIKGNLISQLKADIEGLEVAAVAEDAPKTAGGYYSRPVADTSNVEDIQERLSTLSGVMRSYAYPVEQAVAAVEKATADYETAGTALESAYKAYTAAPTQETATAYNQAVTAYQKAKAGYESAYSTYKTAYDQYKVAEDSANQVFTAWQQYADQSQAGYDAWRQTIRDPETITREMAWVDERIAEAKEGDFFGLWANSPEVRQWEERKALLQEEYDWAVHADQIDIQSTPYFGTLSKQDRLMVIDMTEMQNWPEEDKAKFEHWLVSRRNAPDDVVAWADAYGWDRLEEIESSLRRYNNQQSAQETVRKAQEAADGTWGGIWTSLAARAANLWGTVTSPFAVAQELLWYDDRYGNLDPNAKGFQANIWAGAAQDTVAKNIAGDKYDENGNQVSDGGIIREAASQFYGAGMSAVDNLARLGVGLAIGGGSSVTLGLAALGSFGDTVRKISEQGGSPAQALAMGVISGGLEVLTEKYSVENLLKVAKGDPLNAGKILKEALKQGAVEVSEEEINFLASTLAEAAIMQEKSSYNLQVKELMAKGMSEAEAREQANLSLIQEAAETAVQSFLSGGMMTGAVGAVNNIRFSNRGSKLGLGNVTQEQAQATVADGLENDPESEVYRAAARLKEKMDAGEMPTRSELAKIEALEIIQSGLDSAPGTEAYQMAVNLKAKLDAGKTLTKSELAQQLNANEQAIQAETQNAAPTATVSSATAETTGRQTEIDEIEPLRPRAVDDGEGAPVSQNAPTDLSVSVAEQIRREENQDGGTQHENTYGASAEPATAQSAGEPQSQAGSSLLYGGGQRNAGTGTGEQTGDLAGRTGLAAQGPAVYAGAGRIQAAVNRTSLARNLQLPKVSSIDIGLTNGTEGKNLRVLPREHWDGELQTLAQRVYNETGKEAVFVVGDIYIRGKDGKAHKARAAITETQIVLRADYTKVPLEQILDHEIYHDKVDFARQGRYNLNTMVEERILETFSEEEFRAVLDAYIDALGGRFGLDGEISNSEFEEIIRKIKEELFADAYAGINTFGAGADKFTETVDGRMAELNLGKRSAQENGTAEPTGPPSGENENTAGFGGERYSTETREDRRIFADMPDAQRAGILMQKQIRVPTYDSSDPVTGPQIMRLRGKYVTEARALLSELARQCGDFGSDLHNADIDLSFVYSNKSLKESVNKQSKRGGGAETFGKMLTVLPQICENAVEIEAHADRYAQTARADSRLKEMHILLGAFKDGEYCVPVQLEVKEYKEESEIKNKLYVTVTMKNEAGVTPRGSTASSDSVSVRSRPASVITVADLIANVKDETGGLVKYFPNQMLNSAQLEAKEKAIAEDNARLGDMRYEYAVQQGNQETVNEMLREQATKAGYSAGNDWRMAHRAPNRDQGVTLDRADEVYGGDGSIHSAQAHQFYGEGRSYDMKAIVAINKAWRDPGGSITVYRAVPTDIRDTKLRNGDWVTPTKEYAREHGERTFNDGFRVIEQQVPVKHLYTNGDSIHEFGYDNGRDTEVYRNTENNVKLAKVTYDDDGNLIPISKRFDRSAADERYSADDDETVKSDEQYLLDEEEYRRITSEKAAQMAQWEKMYLYDRLGEEGAEKYNATKAAQEAQQKAEKAAKRAEDRKAREQAEVDVQSRPTEAKKILRKKLLQEFSVPDGKRGELGGYIDGMADRIIKHGVLTEEDRRALFSRMYEAGAMTVPAEEYYAQARSFVKDSHIYVPDSVVADFGDDWQDIRRRAFAAGIYLTRSRTDGNGHSVSGIDVWNSDLAAELPGLFRAEDTDQASILEKIVSVAELGKDDQISLAEYVARVAKEEYTSESDVLDSLERQMVWALKSFAETAQVEIQLKDRNLRRVMRERQENMEKAQRAKERRELQELQKKTLKSLQWLSKNRRLAPEELRETWDEILSDIDLYAVGAANEMNWSDKYQATWKDLAQMYKDARTHDPNFSPSDDLDRIVSRLDDRKIADMDIGALMELYKAAVGLRTEFYNRNNVINDEQYRLFEEIYTDAKTELTEAGKKNGGNLDRLFNIEQLSAMNVLERMAGWNPDSAWYSMARQLERGERDVRAFTVKANRMLEDFLTENKEWVMKADGQGKDAIWYTVEVPELMEWGEGNKPIFGDTVTVYMTPAQKVHMYLESKNYDNLRHMEGGRTFITDKELYGQGKRQEALAQGRTIRMAPETVKQIVSDLTAEEMELARVLDQYYNSFATQEINRVSNVLYGYDKAMGKHYAPIYTNENYNNSEFGKFDQTAEGVGNLKGRVPYSKNPSYNISAFDAFERNVDQTARFVGMAIPIRNWTTLMNWREYKNSMGDTITHTWGLEHKKYIETLLTDLQGSKAEQKDIIDESTERLLSNYISSVFGFNASIVLKQLGSIPLAGTYLGMRNVPNLLRRGRIDQQLISRYTQDMAWRSMGYSMPETKQLKEHPNWTQTNKAARFAFGGGAITAMDAWAASTLWPWAENKVRKEHPELEMGTQEQIDKGESPFYRKVAEEFENAVARSQSTSDQIHQGRLRKSKNTVTRMFTMFTSDSAQTYNAIRQMIGEYRHYAKNGNKKKAGQAKRAAGTAVTALMINAIWGEAVNLLAALIKNKGKRYRDEEGKLTAASILKQAAMGMFNSLAGTVVGGDTLADMIGAKLVGDKWYEPESMEVSMIQDMYAAVDTAIGNVTGLIKDVADVAIQGENVGEYFRQHWNDMLGQVKDTALEIASYFGIPAANVEAYIVGALKAIPGFEALYDGWFASADKSALGGLTGEDLAIRTGSLLDIRGVDASDETARALAELYEAGYTGAVPGDAPSSVTVDEKQHTLNAGQKQLYERVWADVVSGALDTVAASDRFTEASPEIREKMLKKLYAYAAERAKAEMFDGYEPGSTAEDIAAYAEAGLDIADYFAVKAEGYNADKYLEAVVNGLPEEETDALMEGIEELEPMVGEDQVQYVQKWRMCVDLWGNPDFQLAALATYMDDSQFKKAKTAESLGIDLSDYVKLYEIRAEYDENGNKSFSGAEYKKAIDSLRLSTNDSAVLWQLVSGAKSAKNNPYSVEIGQKVLDAMA